MKKPASRTLLQISCGLAILLAWEFGARMGLLDPFFFGSPSGVITVLTGWFEGPIWTDILATLTVFFGGWAIGMLIGITIGAVLFSSPVLLRIASPFLAFLNATPRMVFYPFFGLLLGFSVASKIGLVVFVIFVFVILDVIVGLDTVDRDQISHVRILGGNTLETASNVYLPALGGRLLSSSRVTLAFALQATLISEFFGPAIGLGYRVVAGQGAFEINQVWAAIFLTLVLAVIVDVTLQLVGRRMSYWRTA